MVWLEGKVGTPDKVAEYTGKAAALADAINARLFHADAGLTSTPTPGPPCSRWTPT